MSKWHLLKQLLVQHKYKLATTYLLFSIEMIALLLRPFFLGWAINDLLEKKYSGLVFLIIAHIVYIIVGTVRHMYDTRTYTAIYTSLVTQLFTKTNAATNVSKQSAHSSLARELINFLESDLVWVIEALYNVVGGIIMLSIYNVDLVWPCIIVLVPVIILSRYYGIQMENLYKNKNDELEKQVDILGKADKTEINKHYSLLRHWQIKISNQEALNFSLLEILVLALIVVTLVISTKSTALLVGDIVGIYSYVLKFVSGLDTVPYTVERVSTLSDISSRLQQELNNEATDED